VLSLVPVPGGVVAVTAGPAQSLRMVVVETGGGIRCRTEITSDLLHLVGSELWDVAGGRRISLEDCGRRGAAERRTERVIAVVGSGDAVFGLGPQGGIVRYDTSGGGLRRTAARQGMGVLDLVVGADGVWGTTQEAVVLLDSENLEIVEEWEVLDCPYGGYPLPILAGGHLWVVNDCEGRLHRIDPRDGSADKWWLPHDDFSDQEILAVAAEDGLWFVDAEQTSEPYFFSFERERFERLPDGLRDPEIWAWTVHVRPGT
jgi:hypothetical protein